MRSVIGNRHFHKRTKLALFACAPIYVQYPSLFTPYDVKNYEIIDLYQWLL